MTDRTGVLKNSPLIYVLASIRFASWPLMAKKIDEIHDELRDIAPLINRIQKQTIVAGGQASQNNDFAPAAWMFMPSDQSFGIQFAPDQVLYVTKKYSRYDDFENVLDRVIEVLLNHMRFIDVTNMGIRYIDHIKAQENDSIENYIDSDLLPADIGDFKKLGGSISGTYLGGNGELRVSSICQPGVFSVPENLIPLLAMMNVKDRQFQIEFLKDNELLLDIDSLKNFPEPQRLPKEEILDGLSSLHEIANNFFRDKSVCTDHAFQVWKGEA